MKHKETKSEILKIRLTPTEKALITDEFNAMNVNAPTWFRQYMLPILKLQNKARN